MNLTVCWKEWAEHAGRENYRVIYMDVPSSRRHVFTHMHTHRASITLVLRLDIYIYIFSV